MIEKVKKIISDYDEITKKISDPNIMSDIKSYTKLAKEEKHISRIIPKAKEYVKLYTHLKEDEEILLGNDVELKELVKDELSELKQKIQNLETELEIQILNLHPTKLY